MFVYYFEQFQMAVLSVSFEQKFHRCFWERWARLQQEGPRKGETLKIVMEKVCEVLRFSTLSEQEWLDGPVKVQTLITININIDDQEYTVRGESHNLEHSRFLHLS